MATYASGQDLANSPAWANVNQAVTKQAGLIRVAQKVFPGVVHPSGQPVPGGSLDTKKMTIGEGFAPPFIRIAVEFTLTPDQVKNEDTLHAALTLAPIATNPLGQMEDRLIIQGQNASIPTALQAVVEIDNAASANNGLLGIASLLPNPVDPTDTNTYPQSIFAAVTAGISVLNAKLQPPPYALLLDPETFADTYRPVGGTLATVADIVTPLVTGGFYSTEALQVPVAGKAGQRERYGLLASVGAGATTIYVDTDPIAIYTQTDSTGNANFLVYERFLPMPLTGDPFVKFQIKKP